MASVPPEDGSILPTGWTWGDIGHGALDVIGIIPGLGEAADLTNAAWYAAEGNYLDAGLSVISMVPVVGDIIGKGGKIAKRAGGKLSGPALDALRKMDFKKTLEPLKNNSTFKKVLGPDASAAVDKMIDALEKWRKELVGEAPPALRRGRRFVQMPRIPPALRPTKHQQVTRAGPLPETPASRYQRIGRSSIRVPEIAIRHCMLRKTVASRLMQLPAERRSMMRSSTANLHRCRRRKPTRFGQKHLRSSRTLRPARLQPLCTALLQIGYSPRPNFRFC